jgi:flagellar biosynthesis component FlhA
MKTSVAAKEADKAPLRLEIGHGLIPLFDKEKNRYLPGMVRGEIKKSGLFIPPIRICDNSKLDDMNTVLN